MKTKMFISVGLFGVWLSLASAQANDLARISQGSTNVSVASGMIVTGSMATLANGGNLIVSGIGTAGESVLLTLKSSAETGAVSVRIPAAVVGTASIAVGTTIQAIVESTGYALLASGKLVGFIPNEVGTSLIHHSQHVK